MFMIMFVLDNPDQLEDVLQAWESVGIRGATIVESTGIRRRLKQIVPMRYMFPSPGMVEEGNLTLFAIVENEAIVQACLAATEEITGNLDGPNTGVLATWPLALVKGLPPAQEGQAG